MSKAISATWIGETHSRTRANRVAAILRISCSRDYIYEVSGDPMRSNPFAITASRRDGDELPMNEVDTLTGWVSGILATLAFLPS